MQTLKTYSANTRELAALICAMAALSNSQPVESYFHLACELNEFGLDHDALELATEAWCEVAQCWNGNTWSNEIHGEVEALIHSGWNPGDTITFKGFHESEKLFAFGELEEPAVVDDQGIAEVMAEIPDDADFFDLQAGGSTDE